MDPWIHDWIETQEAEHGTMPPPWVYRMEHPYSMGWRMGDGESHMIAWWEWWEWWEAVAFTEARRVDYFRPWPPPAAWLAWVIEAVWEVDAYEESPEAEACFERTEALGWGGAEAFEEDLDDPKWKD